MKDYCEWSLEDINTRNTQTHVRHPSPWKTNTVHLLIQSPQCCSTKNKHYLPDQCLLSGVSHFFQNASLLLSQCMFLSTLRMPSLSLCVCIYVCSWGWVITDCSPSPVPHSLTSSFNNTWKLDSTMVWIWSPPPLWCSPAGRWLRPELCNVHRTANDIIHLFNKALMKTRQTISRCHASLFSVM